MIFLQLAIVSHILSDFVFQTNKLVKEKESKNIKRFNRAHRIHSLTVFITCFLLLFFPCSPDIALAYSLVVAVSHYFIDTFKYRSSSKKEDTVKYTSPSKKAIEKFISFLLDQILHITVILITWGIFQYYFGTYKTWMSNLIYLNFGNLLSRITTDMIINILNTLIVYIFVCWGGAVIVSLTLNLLGISSSNTAKNKHNTLINAENEMRNLVGKYIGVFERLIIMTLVIKKEYSAIGFVFAAKSLARANDIIKKDETFAEYYLVGTLLSTLIAMLGGLLLYYMLGYK